MKSLIFDIDGTLWDSTGLVAEGYNAQLRDENLTKYCVTAHDLKKLFGKTMTEIADILFYDIDAPERYAIMDRCMTREDAFLHANPCDIGYPGVKETLEKLKERNRLFIVSNSQKGYPDLVIEKLHLEGLIEGHLCYGDTQTSKGETIKKLMADYNISDAAYIGDTQGDMEATYFAGLPFVFCAYGFGSPEKWDWKIDQFEDLLKIF